MIFELSKFDLSRLFVSIFEISNNFYAYSSQYLYDHVHALFVRNRGLFRFSSLPHAKPMWYVPDTNLGLLATVVICLFVSFYDWKCLIFRWKDFLYPYQLSTLLNVALIQVHVSASCICCFSFQLVFNSRYGKVLIYICFSSLIHPRTISSAFLTP